MTTSSAIGKHLVIAPKTRRNDECKLLSLQALVFLTAHTEML
jgi:hypothetical protein